MWYKYKIDYEYGIADMYVKDDKPDNPQELFFDLAYQCFGIRKSIGTTEVFGPIEIEDEKMVEISEAYIPGFDSDLLRALAGEPHRDRKVETIPTEEAKFILSHSGGDTIVWSDKNTKLKSEWDD